jgi:Phosphodiester glycosidase
MRFRWAPFFLAVAATAHAEWAINSADSEPGGPGVVHRRVILENAAANDRAIIDLAIFSAKTCTLRVIDNQDGVLNLAEAMKRGKCLAGVNGGYFGPDSTPLGLLISDGKIITPLIRARLLTGMLGASSRGVQILRSREFSPQQKFNAVVQCGPFLVDRGQSLRGLEKTRLARRTFAAVGSPDRAALGFCSEVSLASLGEILATKRLASDLKIERALNLDGGSSSAFWVAHESGGAFSISEQKNVRDFVGIVAK